MARQRFQEGSLSIEGKRPRYVVRFRIYRSDGTHMKKKVSLGYVSELSKRAVAKKCAEVVAEHTSRLPPAVAAIERADTPFEEFYRDRFLVMKTGWSEAHRASFTYVVEHFILPHFGSMPIRLIDKVMIQTHLNRLSPRYSQSTLKHVRTKMVEVLEEALEQEFLHRNPAKRCVVPAMARPPQQPILTEQNLIEIIDRLTDPRDLAIFLVGTFCALRTSELFGMPWRDLHLSDVEGDSYFLVEQTSYRGKLKPKTKTKASTGRVPIAERTLQAILRWKEVCPDIAPDALVFASNNKNGRSCKGAPMFPSTWLQKHLQPIARSVGVPFPVDFRATRRTAASLIQDHGAALATAQSLLRHASPHTTASVYSKPVPESVKVAVNSYEARIYGARPKTPTRTLIPLHAE